MNIPANLQYSKDHEWVLMNADGTATVGITDYAQDALGDIVYVELPALGPVDAGAQVSSVESVKAVSDILCPVSGEITEVNTELESAPEKLNADPYGTWIFKLTGPATGELMDATAYERFLAQEG